MAEVQGLIWDDWNRKHLAGHQVSQGEVEEVCQGQHQTVESYHKRILLLGKTKTGRQLAVVLSPEDRGTKPYGKGIYYVITAFEKEVKI